VYQDVVGKVEGQVGSHEEYRKAYIACLDWLANTKHRLQRLSDFSGDKRSLQDRLQQLRVRHNSKKGSNLSHKHKRLLPLFCFYLCSIHSHKSFI
jgi:hypothetical protein